MSPVSLCSLSLNLSHPQIAIDLLSVTVDQFAFSRVLCKQNHAVCILFVWLLSLRIITLRFIHVAV